MGGSLNKKHASSKKKCIISGVTGIIVGIIITGGIGVAAVTLNAKDIKYTPSNENFTVRNVQEAIDEVYKISEYEIPADTYFYDADTNGESIVRYKKVNNSYYLCDKNGKVTNETEQDVSNLTLLEYTSMKEANLSKGKAGYSNKYLYLGNGVDSNILENLSKLDITQISQREHGAQGSAYSYTHNIEKASDYRYLLVLLVGFSNVETSNGTDTSGKNTISVSTGEIKTLLDKYKTTNGNANVSVGLYLIVNYKDNMEISVFTRSSGLEYIYGIK